MNNISYVFVDGNLTRDPEFSITSTGKSLAKFPIAVNHNRTNNDVSFFDIETWDKLAENCNEYLKKGAKVTVIGILKQNIWTSQDGIKKSSIKIVVQQVRFDNENMYASKNSDLSKHE